MQLQPSKSMGLDEASRREAGRRVPRWLGPRLIGPEPSPPVCAGAHPDFTVEYFHMSNAFTFAKEQPTADILET